MRHELIGLLAFLFAGVWWGELSTFVVVVVFNLTIYLTISCDAVKFVPIEHETGSDLFVNARSILILAV